MDDITDYETIEQDRNRFLAVSADLQVIITHIDGCFRWVSPAFERLLGWTIEETVTRRWRDFVHPDDVDKSLAEADSVLSGGETFAFENRYRHKNGTYRWLLWNAKSYPNSGKLEIYATAIDITSHRRLESNQTFLAVVSQDLIETSSVDGIIQTIGVSLNRYLHAAVCAFVEVAPEASGQTTEVVIDYSWQAINQPNLTGVYTLPEQVAYEIALAAQAGEPIVVQDLATDSRVIASARLAELGISTGINIPLLKDGHWQFSLAIFHSQQYDWQRDAIALVRELANRVWTQIERVRAESTLQSSQLEAARQLQNFDTTLSTVTDFIFRFGRDGRFLYANQVLLDLWGLTSAESIGKTMADLQYPQAVEQQITGNLQQVFETGITVKDETAYTSPSGRDGYFEYILSPIFATDGTVEFVTGSSRDISERIRTESALRESENRFRMAIEAAHLGTWDWDLIANRIVFDEACQTILGLASASEPTSKDLFTVLHPNEHERIDALVKQALRPESGGKYDVEFRVVGFQGQLDRWVAAKGQVYFDVAGCPQHFVGIVMDMTEQKHLNEERERILAREQEAREIADRANRLKDEFLAVLSHELRSPLNPILGWTKLLQKGNLDAERQAKALETIERNAKLQSQLIEDLLDISRIMQGKLSLTPAPVNLATVVAAAVETVRLAADAKQIQIRLDLTPFVDQVMGDAARLQQVVWNLLTNAIKFTPSGGQVSVELRQLDRLVQLQVIDEGKGIKPDFLPYLFEYFHQEDSSMTRSFGGLGLGLAIVRQIVAMHGGTITAQSEGEQRGATFTVQVPAIKQDASGSEPTRSLLDATQNPLANLRILLVDDSLDACEFQSFLLEQKGAEVTVVTSGIEALKALDQFVPDILVSDLGMPEMDGYELIQAIRTRRAARGGEVRAIALTAYAAEQDQKKALQAGFQTHLTKPIESEKLIRTILELQQQNR